MKSKTIKRGAIVVFVLGMITQGMIAHYFVPKALAFWESKQQVVEYTRSEDTEATADKVDRYYHEEYSNLEAKYEQLRQDEARLNAIEKVEGEFESIKEEIRERELGLI